MDDYADFLNHRVHAGAAHGFDPTWMPDGLFDFQTFAIEWAIRQGRGALFADCGLGKTVKQLTWAYNVHLHTGKPVLVLTPLAVSAQMVEEAHKFGIDAGRSRDGAIPAPVTISNYEKLHLFDPSVFGGVACDESSILKSFDGKRKDEITRFMRKVPYRLLATATAAPNDYTELGTSSEALGYLGFTDMLGRFFRNDQNNVATKRMYGEAPKWRFKGHAELPFWRWVASWARAYRKPSDIGFTDADFVLPDLIERTNIIDAVTPRDGMLFNLPANTLPEQREEKRRTIDARCERVADLVDDGEPFVSWCQLNDEGDRLAELIGDAIQVSGKDSDDAKEEKFAAFQSGQVRGLICKPKIGAWGLNWQHAAHITFFPSHSYEQYYQAIRRCWRFGQKRQVTVDIVLTEGEKKILQNQQKKAEQAMRMFGNLVAEMNNAAGIKRFNEYTNQQEVPLWL